MSVALGAPGVYFAPQTPPRVLGAEAMDVVAFVGVAPRGPAWEPVDDSTLAEQGVPRARSVAVAVDSWDDYQERFGGFEGPGLLPHAVATFFEQGGRRAYVVRIVHDELDRTGVEPVPLGCARYEVPSTLVPLGSPAIALRARNEGRWGNALSATFSFSAVPLAVRDAEPYVLVLDRQADAPAGALLRLTAVDGTKVLRSVLSRRSRGRRDGGERDVVVTLDGPVGGVPPARVERVDPVLSVVDGDPARARLETFAGLGLRPGHPRWVGDVLRDESALVELEGAPLGIDLTDPTLPDVEVSADPDHIGEDRWHLVAPEDVFGSLLLGGDAGTEGLDALVDAAEVASIVVADLYSPGEVVLDPPVVEPATFAGPEFGPCVVLPEVRHAPPERDRGLDGLRLDPTVPEELERIVALQQEVVRVGEALRAVAMLDVPPGLHQRGVLRWRSKFDSSYAAAYHPWLRRPTSWPDGKLRAINPAAVAAGIVARTERRFGVPHGPANEPAARIVDVLDRVDRARHDELHASGIDVFRVEPDAVWLTAARTLAADRSWRQLSVRRLVSLIERSVEHQLQWTVFEPNGTPLRSSVERLVDQLLGGLFLTGAFAGATPAESYFLRVAEDLHTVTLESDAGLMVCEIGVAPSEPLEFIVVRVDRDADGTLRAGVARG